MEKIWFIEDPDELLGSKKRTAVKEPPPDKKNPATAYSLSIMLWGSGQFYADLIGKGLAFLFLMFLTAAGIVLSVLNRNGILDLLRSHRFALADVFLLAELLLLAVLIFWAYNAADAYHAAARERRRSFTGVKSRIFPALCSMCIPGWGQYLNGQPVKGGIYASLSVISYFALFVVPLTLIAWSSLEATGSRDIIEEIFAATVLIALAVPLIWIFSCYDALKVSRDDYLKEPFFERVKAMNNRRRTQGWVRGVFPRIGNIFALFVVLALLVAASYWAFPEGYYISLLGRAEQYLRHQGMTIVPGIIGTMLLRLPHP